MGASFHTFYTVLEGNSGISKNKSTSLWNLVLNSGLKEYFATAYRIIDHRNVLSTEIKKGVINWTVIGQHQQYPQAPTLN